MERRAEYVTAESPEYHAAGLDLVAAELEICELQAELARLRHKYMLTLAVIRRQQELIRKLETSKHG